MKKNKFVPLLTLVLCMSAFFIPTTAYAQSPADTTPPTVSAKLSGETLRVEASDDNSGVDAVFIDGKRVNYRVDSAVDVALKDYAGTGTQVNVYAVDFAGNKSTVVQIKNPYYKQTASAPTPTPTPKPTKPSASASADPEAPTDPKPFTPDGQATVTDNATNEDGKEFYTITTPNENVFYLVIDKQRDSDNVYFLNAVTENDLLALAEKPKETESAVPDPICACKEKCELGAVDTTCPLCVTSLKTCVGKAPATTPDTEPEKPKKEGGNGGMMIFILIAAAVVGGAGYYFKIYKPKQDLDDAEDFDELTGGADEPTVNEDSEDMAASSDDDASESTDTPESEDGSAESDEPDEPEYGEPDENDDPEEWQ